MKNIFLKKGFTQYQILHKRFSTGFTMIEILVVCAIMATLATIVILKITTVQNRTGDLAVKSNLQLLRVEARKYIDRYGNFGTATVATPTVYPQVDGSSQALCSTADTIFADPKMNTYIIEAENNSDPSSKWVAVCAVGKGASDINATSWAVAVRLNENAGQSTGSADGYYYWCVGSNESGRISGGIIGGGASTVAACM